MNKDLKMKSKYVMSYSKRKRRLELPTTSALSTSSKKRRINETIHSAFCIHGASPENKDPALHGLVDTLTSKFKAKILAKKLVSSAKKKLKKAIVEQLKSQKTKVGRRNPEESSEENVKRSMRVYYSQGVLGRRNYDQIRRANKSPGVTNFIQSGELSRKIRSINIGEVKEISEFTKGLDPGEIGAGCYRPLNKYAPRLAEYYLKVNEEREDKLKTFENLPRKDPSSFLFLMAIGGDEAPGAGTTYLISFLNAGKRVASSSENFLIFGANVKEDGQVVRNYLASLLTSIKYLESQVFKVDFKGEKVKVEFKLASLPNDLKNLAFIAGELPCSATYFSTFANVTKHDSNTLKFYEKDWKAWKYDDRVINAKKVEKKEKRIRVGKKR